MKHLVSSELHTENKTADHLLGCASHTNPTSLMVQFLLYLPGCRDSEDSSGISPPIPGLNSAFWCTQSGNGTEVSPRTSVFPCQYIPAVFHPHSPIADTAIISPFDLFPTTHFRNSFRANICILQMGRARTVTSALCDKRFCSLSKTVSHVRF